MSLKTIVVFVDPSSAGRTRACYAVKMAVRHGAYLIGVFVAPPFIRNPNQSYVLGDEAMKEFIRNRLAEETRETDRVRSDLETATTSENVGFEFRVMHQDNGLGEARPHPVYADLAIIGLQPPTEAPGPVGRLLIETGTPLLLLPQTWNGTTLGERILLGWNASREARRAIIDALPLLTTAESVTITIVDPKKRKGHGEEPGIDIARFVSRHGVNVEVMRVESDGKPVADVMLTCASRINADMIVIGAYSHNRSMEALFGGVTTSLIEKAAVPLLIAH